MAGLNSSFEVLVNATLNTQQAQQQLNEFTKTREIVTKIKVENPQTKQVEDGFKKITTSVNNYGQTLREVQKLDINGNVLSSEIKSVGDSFKNVVSATKDYKEGIRGVTEETQKYTDSSGASVNKLTKTFTDIAGNTKQVITTTSEYTDSLGQLRTRIVQTDESGNQLAPTIDRVGGAAKSSSGNVSLLGGVLDNLRGRFAAANIAARIIQEGITLFKRGVSEAIEAAKDYDAAITEMGKVSVYSGEQLREYGERLGELGTQVGRTRAQMVEGTTGWLKAGFDEELAANLAETTALLQNTADEELEASEATSILVSQIKGFREEAGTTNEEISEFAGHVTDSINQVSQDFAVSSADISRGLTQAGAALGTYGNSFDQTVGLITAGTEING